MNKIKHLLLDSGNLLFTALQLQSSFICEGNMQQLIHKYSFNVVLPADTNISFIQTL